MQQVLLRLQLRLRLHELLLCLHLLDQLSLLLLKHTSAHTRSSQHFRLVSNLVRVHYWI
jgi:hypothetical protein